MKNYKVIYEAQDGCNAYIINSGVPKVDIESVIPNHLLRKTPPELPDISELGLVRHYTGLSKRNAGVDNLFYPLGSCTMKYNPKINEAVASLAGFTKIHPLQDADTVQGALEAMYLLENHLCKITGMDAMTLQPAAGAHGELCGLMIIKAYHEKNKDTKRDKIIIPDSAHGTNPASASMAGFTTVEIKSAPDGGVDIDALKAAVGEDTAGLMLTNPSTLGLFEKRILEIADIVHNAGGLLYYDGANLNAIMGICRPGDMGFDVVHLNLHKTFSTPHGGGGPGSGPVGVKSKLKEFLPDPRVARNGNKYEFISSKYSIGKMKSFYGNFGVMLRALAYILSLGGKGLKEACEQAVLNANYIKCMLENLYDIPYKERCMHEFVISAQDKLEQYGIHVSDISKALIDRGYHPPTMYFPLIVKEALMIEPTETESKRTLDEFIQSMIEIAELCETDAEVLKKAPVSTPVGRLDETLAARKPKLNFLSNE